MVMNNVLMKPYKVPITSYRYHNINTRTPNTVSSVDSIMHHECQVIWTDSAIFKSPKTSAT